MLSLAISRSLKCLQIQEYCYSFVTFCDAMLSSTSESLVTTFCFCEEGCACSSLDHCVKYCAIDYYACKLLTTEIMPQYISVVLHIFLYQRPCKKQRKLAPNALEFVQKLWFTQVNSTYVFVNWSSFQVADGYLVKYTASIIGLSVFAAPFYFSKEVWLVPCYLHHFIG
jgi:hypothetical protein